MAIGFVDRHVVDRGLAAGALGAPALASAQGNFNWKMTSAYPKGDRVSIVMSGKFLPYKTY